MDQRQVTHRDVVAIAWPMILANLSVPIVGLVDTAVLGHLDYPAPLAGVAIGASVFNILFTALNFLRMGTTGLTAQSWGAASPSAIQDCLIQGLVVALALAAAMLLLAIPIERLALLLMAPEPAVALQASAYIGVRIWAAPATLSLFVLSGWFIGQGDARSPLILVAIVHAVNVVLDLVLVRGFGMEADGVAWASLAAEYCGLAAGIGLARRLLGGWRWSRSPDAQSYSRYLALNVPLLLRTLTLMLAIAFLTAMGARQGTLILAANALLLNFLYIAASALDGLANAAEALVGRAVGARDAARARLAMLRTAQWTGGVALVLTLIFAAGGGILIDGLTSQPGLEDMARRYLPWLIAAPLICAWAYLYDGIFIGATLNREMLWTMLFAALVVYLPAWWLTQGLGNHGLWLSFLAFNAGRGLSQAWLLRRRMASGELLPAC